MTSWQQKLITSAIAGDGITINNGTVSYSGIELVNSTSVLNNGTINADFSKYRFLIVNCDGPSGENDVHATFIMSLTEQRYGGGYKGSFIDTIWDSSFNKFLVRKWILYINQEKTQATVNAGFYNESNFYGNYYIGRIWGIK